jgi:hypothetical protein
MTCEPLVHALGCETPRTMRELLDVATQYATGEEVIQANFSYRKPRVLTTSVVVTVPMIPAHLNDAATGETWTKSTARRRWSPRPTPPRDLSPTGALHTWNISRRRSSPPVCSMGSE